MAFYEASAFKVVDDLWDYLAPDMVYVWGYGLPAGHVHFAKDHKGRVLCEVRARATASASRM